MGIGFESLRGYILEEVLAYLVRDTGYELLVDERQDPTWLERRGNGLVVRGRGGEHQVDVLGQLTWVPTFTFPLRLFIEAKFRSEPTGIEVVRNAIGVVLDINQNNLRNRGQAPVIQNYQYAYAVCSTSGFRNSAQDMALAHQISLIDIGGPDYADLLNAISESAKRISSPSAEDHVEESNVVRRVRTLLRRDLGMWPPSLEQPWERQSSVSHISDLLMPVVDAARKFGELFVAMANGPYMLLLKADNSRAFLEYCIANPRHDVRINVSDDLTTWTLSPSTRPSQYRVRFSLPAKILDWILSAAEEGDARSRRLQVKESLLSSISIIRRDQDRDYLFRLRFDPESVRSASSRQRVPSELE